MYAFRTHTHTRFMALCPGLPRWAGTRKVKPIWILLKQETVNGSGISWAICKSAPRSRQITTPATHYSVFYRPDALPATQPTASKHWRQYAFRTHNTIPNRTWLTGCHVNFILLQKVNVWSAWHKLWQVGCSSWHPAASVKALMLTAVYSVTGQKQ